MWKLQIKCLGLHLVVLGRKIKGCTHANVYSTPQSSVSVAPKKLLKGIKLKYLDTKDKFRDILPIMQRKITFCKLSI